jgi:hypothetical protein
MASGYIAGGALAGIAIAFVQGVLTHFDQQVTEFMTQRNPFFEGNYADLLSLLPFTALAVLLFLTGREKILAGKPA